jgi:hypothetical protein
MRVDVEKALLLPWDSQFCGVCCALCGAAPVSPNSRSNCARYVRLAPAGCSGWAFCPTATVDHVHGEPQNTFTRTFGYLRRFLCT